jgi:hypothetical protein
VRRCIVVRSHARARARVCVRACGPVCCRSSANIISKWVGMEQYQKLVALQQMHRSQAATCLLGSRPPSLWPRFMLANRAPVRQLARTVAPVRRLRPKRSILLSLRSVEPSISDADVDDTALGPGTQAERSFAGASSFGRRRARVHPVPGPFVRAAPIRNRVPTASFTDRRRCSSRTSGSANWKRVWISNCIGIEVAPTARRRSTRFGLNWMIEFSMILVQRRASPARPFP